MNILLLQPNQLSNNRATVEDTRRIQHIQTYLKLQPGDTLKVGLMDGLKGSAIVEQVSSEKIVLEQVELNQAPPAKREVTLIVCLPRPKVLRRLVMDSTTLGVKHLIFLHSYRVEKSYWHSPKLQELDEYVTLGLEQAGDTVPPQINLYRRFRPFVEDDLPKIMTSGAAWVAHPYASEVLPAQFSTPTLLIIGPEGGFISYEIDLLTQSGIKAGTLGDRILRTETAVSVLLGRC